MCGFGGVVNHSYQLNRNFLTHIAGHVKFRGPDSCGVRILNDSLKNDDVGNTGIFFNRLSIIDLDNRSDQPFEDEHHLLVFNGEIYNYHDLKKTLQKAGYHFRTSSDTEVLFLALKHWGTNALTLLNGMFAFFWLNKRERTAIICRDRLGIQPLYYSHVNGSFFFSSELSSIVRLLNNKPEISHDSVLMYLWMQFVPTPYSIFKNIFKLPPGTYLRINLDAEGEELHPKAYWDAYEVAGSHTPPQTKSNFEKILKDSISRQLQADVPIGLFLSSGVDSSLLAAMVHRYFSREEKVNFFTIGFEEEEITDESNDAKDFIRGFNNSNLIAHTLYIGAKHLQNRLSTLYNFYDEPFGDYASILNWAVSEKAKEHVTVALSGDGADELFWGYQRYNRWQTMATLNSLGIISAVPRAVSTVLPSFAGRNKLSRAFIRNPVKRYLSQFLLPAFRKQLDNVIENRNIWALHNIETVAKRPDFPAIVDIKTYLADAMLYKVDRSSMASSLEVRVPYLDNEMLEYSLGLPFREKSNTQFKNKAALKKLLIEIAPHYDISRPKKGFSFPLEKWLKTEWQDQVRDMISKETLTSFGLDGQFFIREIDKFYSKKNTGNAVEIWYLFNLMLWKEKFDQVKYPTV